MKKTRLFSLLALILLVSLILTSCNTFMLKSVLKSLYNDEFDDEEIVLSTVEEITELEGYSRVQTYKEQKIAIFKKDIRGSHISYNYTSYKIYNLLTKSVVLTLKGGNPNYANDFHYLFTVLGYHNILIVNKQYNTEKSEYIAYDFMGNELARSDYKFSSSKNFGDYVLFDNRLYKPDEATGALEEAIEIDSFVIPNASELISNGEYLYSSQNNTISVYDTEFNPIYCYQAPSYFNTGASFDWFVLDNGKIFIQGSYSLPEDAKKFDYYTTLTSSPYTTVKSKLYQAIINPKSGRVKEVDLGCVVAEVVSEYDLNQEQEGFYAEGFKNIAYTYPIVDKRIDRSEAMWDISFMNNNGKLSKSIKLLEGQRPELPKKLSSDRYLVPMLGGTYTLTNQKGKVIASGITSPKVAGKYITSNNAIYDFDMNLVYDTRDVPAGTTSTIYTTTDNTVLVQERTDEYSTYISFKDGNRKEIGKVPLKEDFMVVPVNSPITSFGYVLYNEGKYITYNFNGDILLEHKSEEIAYTEDSSVVISDGKVYLITK